MAAGGKYHVAPWISISLWVGLFLQIRQKRRDRLLFMQYTTRGLEGFLLLLSTCCISLNGLCTPRSYVRMQLYSLATVNVNSAEAFLIDCIIWAFRDLRSISIQLQVQAILMSKQGNCINYWICNQPTEWLFNHTKETPKQWILITRRIFPMFLSPLKYRTRQGNPGHRCSWSF